MNMSSAPSLQFVRPRAARSQRGAILIISLVVLAIMLISAAALMRSFDVSLSSAGNLAFKRDLAQHSEQAVETVLARFRTGGPLATSAARQNSVINLNYSAVALASNAQGIPNALLADNLPANVGTEGDIDAGQSVTLRYVVDRLCTATGAGSETPDNCAVAGANLVPGGSSGNWLRAERAAPGGAAGAVQQQVIYRISVRATGPRNTQSFFQTTFACCGS